MKTYFYKVIQDSSARGFNREVHVYRVKNNQPIFIGYDDRINTASYKGDHAIASAIISKNDKHKMDKKGYFLLSKNIQLLSI